MKMPAFWKKGIEESNCLLHPDLLSGRNSRQLSPGTALSSARLPSRCHCTLQLCALAAKGGLPGANAPAGAGSSPHPAHPAQLKPSLVGNEGPLGGG